MPQNTTSYDKKILPYGAGSTRGMSQRHYEAIADVLRNQFVRTGNDTEYVIRDIIESLADRFASGNDRFRRQMFINAATDAARNNGGTA